MAWTDEPTKLQIGTMRIFLLDAHLDNGLADKALQYLSTHTNRKEFSNEMERIRNLKYAHNLNQSTCFDAPIWREFKEKNNIKEPSFSEVLAEIRRLNKEGNN